MYAWGSEDRQLQFQHHACNMPSLVSVAGNSEEYQY